jgi:hypothetical protein
MDELRAQCGEMRPLAECDLLLSQGMSEKKLIAEVAALPPSFSSSLRFHLRQLLDRVSAAGRRRQGKELFGTISSSDPSQVASPPPTPSLTSPPDRPTAMVSTARCNWLSKAE